MPGLGPKSLVLSRRQEPRKSQKHCQTLYTQISKAEDDQGHNVPKTFEVGAAAVATG